ncbi:PAS fold [Gemmobacter megaterium]|uniref:PAS fold n=1 Tax=Gemmobacter megaterium TaxID=1086013 RepID=A0A1N7MI60_9RHOB|nr:PAS-domain containing protein [Gemmobacter megaterium]GGE06656.1 diguanylate cyclase [Gemmobacter megaterium]SIS85757.1 PAS fold [Gemmobacter megaterium]
MTFEHLIWLFAISFTAATLALAATALAERRRKQARTGVFGDQQSGAVLLFDGDTLLDATSAGRALLAASRSRGTAWQRFMAWAAPRFPGVDQKLAELPDLGRVSLTSAGAEGLTLIAEWRSGVRRIAVLEPHLDSRGLLMDSLAQRAQDEELEALRQITDEAPLPLWREDAAGTITWANRAYVALAMQQAPEDTPVGWPLPRLIEIAADGRKALPASGDGAPTWFDCTISPQPNGGRIVFALPADAAAQAEQALGSFVQTLSKTFAHLPIGLAIFDRQRKLQLFNPALTDLSGLPVDFLSARPGLFAFLDAMRERGMIPEPKDYKSWRLQMAALEESAASGQHEETWALPSGLTYRVIGRPHPEGALALLFQDISDEITRARRMRADLELGQSVIDATDEAIAVFSSAGQLVMSNVAYARLWAHDPSEMLTDQSLAGLAALWRTACAPSHFWSLAESYAASAGPREPWVSQARLNDGRSLRCRLAPLAGGATLVGFSAESGPDMAGDPAMRLILSPDPVPTSGADAPPPLRRAPG